MISIRLGRGFLLQLSNISIQISQKWITIGDLVLTDLEETATKTGSEALSLFVDFYSIQ